MDHLITSDKSFGNHGGVGYKGESSGTKIMFIKSGLLVDLLMPQIISMLSDLLQQKISLLSSSLVATGQSTTFSG